MARFALFFKFYFLKKSPKSRTTYLRWLGYDGAGNPAILIKPSPIRKKHPTNGKLLRRLGVVKKYY
jgi:hypothetical protein